MSQARSEDNVDALRAYLSSVEALPARGGKVSIAAVASAAGIDRQVLYRNPTAKALLEQTVAEKGLIGIEARGVGERSAAEKVLEQRVRSLEARNAALAAENHGLRAQLRKYEHLDQM
ncbi:DUF6262 family protein [Rhodovulum tesquicola]|uniref:DUF6262 family protein n=1 Tax=Rhodovulum tesquicola TaxID=540254 RepID=UPI00339575E8